MAYLQIADFKYGLDRRRERVAGIPGTLWNVENAHISRGGDIQRAKKFVARYELPAGTFGGAQIKGQLYVFGSADLEASMPVGVRYQRLQANSANMVEVVWTSAFDGKLYVIAEFDDGNLYHFYDGSVLTDWDTVADGIASAESLASYLAGKVNEDDLVYTLVAGTTITIIAREAGTGYTLSVAHTDNGADATETITATNLQANVAEVEEVRATGELTVTGGSEGSGNEITFIGIDGVDLLGGVSVPFDTDVSTTAFRVQVQINNGTTTHGYTAEVDGAVVTVTAAPGTGTGPNGDVMTVVSTGNVTTNNTTFIGGGVAYVAPVAQVDEVVIGGLFEPEDLFEIDISGNSYIATGRASGTGTSAFVYKKRMWSTVSSLFQYSKLNDASDWTDITANTGAGFINISNESEGTQRLLCAVTYGEYAAVFSDQNIRLYSLSTTPSENTFQQQLDNTGTIAPRSVISYGSYEAFYLDTTGVRSLRARDSYNIVSVNDIGTAIDPYVQDLVNSLTPGRVSRAVGVVEPIDGRYWLAIDDQVLVLSYFPSSKITAWSVYKPGLSFTDFIRVRNKIYARAGDVIYLYGGESGTEYPDADEQEIVLETPYMDASDPATHKDVMGFDIACTNTWAVTMLPDPNDDTKEIDIGTFTGTTYHKPENRMPTIGGQTHFAFRLTCSEAGNATLSSAVVHYNKIGAE